MFAQLVAHEAEVALRDVADEIARLAVERVELLLVARRCWPARSRSSAAARRRAAATCASSCCERRGELVFVLRAPARARRRPARRSAARRRPPRRPSASCTSRSSSVAELVARERVVLVARVAEADLRAPHLDLPAQLGDLVAVPLEVVLVRVELGLEALNAGRIARDALLRAVAEHAAEAVDARLQRVDLHAAAA